MVPLIAIGNQFSGDLDRKALLLGDRGLVVSTCTCAASHDFCRMGTKRNLMSILVFSLTFAHTGWLSKCVKERAQGERKGFARALGPGCGAHGAGGASQGGAESPASLGPLDALVEAQQVAGRSGPLECSVLEMKHFTWPPRRGCSCPSCPLSHQLPMLVHKQQRRTLHP